MRNRLIHAYFDIDFERIHDTITSDLAPLISILELALGQPMESSGSSDR